MMEIQNIMILPQVRLPSPSRYSTPLRNAPSGSKHASSGYCDVKKPNLVRVRRLAFAEAIPRNRTTTKPNLGVWGW